jgi:hypothetical protein
MEISLKSFLICRDVLRNSRNNLVISIINVFNQLLANSFPIFIEHLCIVAIYGGAPGEYVHHFEIWDGENLIGSTNKETFFLEDRNQFHYVISYFDGLMIEEPKHLLFRAILDDEIKGETSLGIFKPLTTGASKK